MDQELTVHLAGKAYTIRPLTVGQLQDLHVGVVEPMSTDAQENVRQFWRRNLAIIAAALREDHPEVTIEVLSKLRLGNIQQLNETVDGILKFAGLVPKGDAPSGESQGAA